MQTNEMTSDNITPRSELTQFLVSKILITYNASTLAKRLPKRLRNLLRTATYAFLFKKTENKQKPKLLYDADVEYEKLLDFLVDYRLNV